MECRCGLAWLLKNYCDISRILVCERSLIPSEALTGVFKKAGQQGRNE